LNPPNGRRGHELVSAARTSASRLSSNHPRTTHQEGDPTSSGRSASTSTALGGARSLIRPPPLPRARSEPMGEFSIRLRQRIFETETALRRSMYAKDPYAVQVEQGELDSLLRIAAEHGVDVAPSVAA